MLQGLQYETFRSIYDAGVEEKIESPHSTMSERRKKDRFWSMRRSQLHELNEFQCDEKEAILTRSIVINKRYDSIYDYGHPGSQCCRVCFPPWGPRRQLLRT